MEEQEDAVEMRGERTVGGAPGQQREVGGADGGLCWTCLFDLVQPVGEVLGVRVDVVFAREASDRAGKVELWREGRGGVRRAWAGEMWRGGEGAAREW